MFDLHYADGSHLRGFNGVDQVWVSAAERSGGVRLLPQRRASPQLWQEELAARALQQALARKRQQCCRHCRHGSP